MSRLDGYSTTFRGVSIRVNVRVNIRVNIRVNTRQRRSYQMIRSPVSPTPGSDM